MDHEYSLCPAVCRSVTFGDDLFVHLFSPLPSVVCHVELASDFNTSAVYQLTPSMWERHSRRKRNAVYGGLFSLAELEDPLTTIQPRTRGRRHARQAPSTTQPTPPTEPPHLDKEVWTLYGLFQLSSHLVCSDGTTPSPNICGMDCNGEFQFQFVLISTVHVIVTTAKVCAD